MSAKTSFWVPYDTTDFWEVAEGPPYVHVRGQWNDFATNKIYVYHRVRSMHWRVDGMTMKKRPQVKFRCGNMSSDVVLLDKLPKDDMHKLCRLCFLGGE